MAPGMGRGASSRAVDALQRPELQPDGGVRAGGGNAHPPGGGGAGAGGGERGAERSAALAGPGAAPGKPPRTADAAGHAGDRCPVVRLRGGDPLADGHRHGVAVRLPPTHGGAGVAAARRAGWNHPRAGDGLRLGRGAGDRPARPNPRRRARSPRAGAGPGGRATHRPGLHRRAAAGTQRTPPGDRSVFPLDGRAPHLAGGAAGAGVAHGTGGALVAGGGPVHAAGADRSDPGADEAASGTGHGPELRPGAVRRAVGLAVLRGEPRHTHGDRRRPGACRYGPHPAGAPARGSGERRSPGKGRG